MKQRYKLASPILMWAIILLGSVLFFKVMPRELLFPKSWWRTAILALAAINWVYVLIISRKVHHQIARTATEIDKLVTEGAYAVIRHPIYTADIVLAWCVYIALPYDWLLVSALWLTVVMIFWANFEEWALEEKFLEDYTNYKKRVPMFIPRIIRKK